jgi:hypothetical protein
MFGVWRWLGLIIAIVKVVESFWREPLVQVNGVEGGQGKPFCLQCKVVALGFLVSWEVPCTRGTNPWRLCRST